MEILNTEQFIALFQKHNGDLTEIGAYEVTEKVELTAHKIFGNINLGAGVFRKEFNCGVVQTALFQCASAHFHETFDLGGLRCTSTFTLDTAVFGGRFLCTTAKLDCSIFANGHADIAQKILYYKLADIHI